MLDLFVYNSESLLHLPAKIVTFNFIMFSIGENVYWHDRGMDVTAVLMWCLGTEEVCWNGDASEIFGRHLVLILARIVADLPETFFFKFPPGKCQAGASNWTTNSFPALSSSLFTYKSTMWCYILWATHSIVTWTVIVPSFRFHLLSFHRSIQDYKIHMDMEIVIFLESRGETNLEVYSNHMVQYSIWGFFPVQII